jgi:hypothetical protein
VHGNYRFRRLWHFYRFLISRSLSVLVAGALPPRAPWLAGFIESKLVDVGVFYPSSNTTQQSTYVTPPLTSWDQAAITFESSPVQCSPVQRKRYGYQCGNCKLLEDECRMMVPQWTMNRSGLDCNKGTGTTRWRSWDYVGSSGGETADRILDEGRTL